MRRDGVGWWISRASKNISDRGSLDAGGTQILQIHEPFGLGQRRLDRSALPHEGNHLGQTVEIDLSLLGENASFRLEIKGERLPRDLVRRSGQFPVNGTLDEVVLPWVFLSVTVTASIGAVLPATPKSWSSLNALPYGADAAF